MQGQRGFASAVEMAAKIIREAENVETLWEGIDHLNKRKDIARQELSINPPNAYLAAFYSGLNTGIEAIQAYAIWLDMAEKARAGE